MEKAQAISAAKAPEAKVRRRIGCFDIDESMTKAGHLPHQGRQRPEIDGNLFHREA